MSQKCDHCDQTVIIPIKLEDKVFCCEGCKTVFQILAANNLGSYYTLREQSGKTGFAPVEITNQKFKYIDHEEFINKYAKREENKLSMSFYLENVHCVACLWLIERLPHFEKGILSTELNMSKSTVEVTVDEDVKKLSEVAKMLETLGYPPHPIMEENQAKIMQRKEDHKDLIRIAISFFCAGNIMMMAFSIYAGAVGAIKEYFDYISLVLFLPILFYTAIPFYKSAFFSAKNKVVSIDLPIVLALLLGGFLSIYNVFTQGGHVYFDSLATLVFLLLGSRYILKKSQQKGLATSEISNFFTNITSYKLDEEGNETEVFASFLNIDDKIKIYPGDTIPVDGIILIGSSSTNNSLITGEMLPQKVSIGSEVFSGTVNLDSEIIIQVSKSSKDSKLGEILGQVEKGWNKKTEIITLTDTIAKYFVSVVFIIAGIIFTYYAFSGDFYTGTIKALTLVIITCPCALGLATPLSLTLTLSKLAKKGIIVKDELVIEKTNKIKNIFFDKTGTLTNGRFKVTYFENLKEKDHINILYHLEKKSKHPIAKSIINYLLEEKADFIKEIQLDDYEEILGIGPSAKFKNIRYSIRPIKSVETQATSVGLFIEEELSIKIHLEDSLKPSSKEVIKKLNNLGYNPFILSGDNQTVVSKIANELSIPKCQTFAQVSPLDKQVITEKYEHVMMLGDGANDAISLSQVDVGVAVHGSVDISLRASNVFMTNNDLNLLLDLIIASRETINLIKRNLIFSLIYNILGVTLALLGLISPLLAAILMPLSSLTVLLSTVWGTKHLRSSLKA